MRRPEEVVDPETRAVGDGRLDEAPHAAADAFRRARALNRDRGIVARVLRLFDVVAAADPGGTLTPVRAIIAGDDHGT